MAAREHQSEQEHVTSVDKSIAVNRPTVVNPEADVMLPEKSAGTRCIRHIWSATAAVTSS
jgi:hypothetical protein